MAGRIYLANVGANASHRFCSPIFPDGRFEFLPISEDRQLPEPYAVRYADLRSHYDGSELAKYVPSRLWNTSTHNDPEFETFTYGDNCEANPRAASLKRMEDGDFLFFIARLEDWVDDAPTKRYGFYLVGFLEIAVIFSDVRQPPNRATMTKIRNNAHVRRGLSDNSLWDRFWVFKGSKRSRRFHKAVPVTREFASKVFVSADGSPWAWDGGRSPSGEGRSELQVIGSYTRSCRCVIHPSKPDQVERAKAFWDWIARFNELPTL